MCFKERFRSTDVVILEVWGIYDAYSLHCEICLSVQTFLQKIPHSSNTEKYLNLLTVWIWSIHWLADKKDISGQ